MEKNKYIFFKKRFLLLIRLVATAPARMCFMVSNSNLLRTPSLGGLEIKAQDSH